MADFIEINRVNAAQTEETPCVVPIVDGEALVFDGAEESGLKSQAIPTAEKKQVINFHDVSNSVVSGGSGTYLLNTNQIYVPTATEMDSTFDTLKGIFVVYANWNGSGTPDTVSIRDMDTAAKMGGDNRSDVVLTDHSGFGVDKSAAEFDVIGGKVYEIQAVHTAGGGSFTTYRGCALILRAFKA